MIETLWIDDKYSEEFIGVAYKRGFNIDAVTNMEDGLNKLLDKRIIYDAIILDANCFTNSKQVDGDQDVTALGEILGSFKQHKIDRPWFVYSAADFKGPESINIIMKSNPTWYNPRHEWYKKGDREERDRMFNDIKKVLNHFDFYKWRYKYAYLIDKYPHRYYLLNILQYLDENKSKDPEIFNLIRKELEFIMDECYKWGLLTVQRKGANLNECSKALCEKKLEKFIPVYIQRAFHSTSTICNEGSHRLVIDTDVQDGKAPTLVRSTVYEFLNIVHWYNESIPETDEEIEKYKKDVQEELNKKCTDPNAPAYYEGQTMEYEKDENGDYHCGLCCINRDYDVINKGKQIVLHGITTNMNARTKERYPLFAKKIENKK